MRRFLGVFVIAAALVIAAILVAGDDDQGPGPATAPTKQRLVRCPRPAVTALTVRPVSEDGERIALRARAEVERGDIGAFDVEWGDNSALIADLGGSRRISLRFEHRYRGPGTYRIAVVAESSTKGCRRLQKSAPATIPVRIPLAEPLRASPSSP